MSALNRFLARIGHGVFVGAAVATIVATFVLAAVVAQNPVLFFAAIGVGAIAGAILSWLGLIGNPPHVPPEPAVTPLEDRCQKCGKLTAHWLLYLQNRKVVEEVRRCQSCANHQAMPELRPQSVAPQTGFSWPDANRVEIAALSYAGDHGQNCIQIMQAEGERHMPVYLSPTTVAMIYRRLKGIAEAPTTLQSWLRSIADLGAEPIALVIETFLPGANGAKLVTKQGNQQVVLRTSTEEGIMLAVLAGLPLYLNRAQWTDGEFIPPPDVNTGIMARKSP